MMIMMVAMIIFDDNDGCNDNYDDNDCKGTPPEKKFSFGHCPNEGGGGPCPIFLTFFLPCINP